MPSKLPPKLERARLSLVKLYVAAYAALKSILYAAATYGTLRALLRALFDVLTKLIQGVAVWVRKWVRVFTLYFTREAEANLPGAIPRTYTEAEYASIERGVMSVFTQTHQDTRNQLVAAVREQQKLRGTDQFATKVIDQGLRGLEREGGSHYRLDVSGDALSRTRLVQLQSEVAVQRYREEGVERLRFKVGTACRFYPVTCEMLDGTEVDINAIPPGWLPPRHVYGNSTVEPVLR